MGTGYAACAVIASGAMGTQNLDRIAVVAIALLVTGLFVEMVRPFILSIVMAGVFSAMAQPLYRRIEAMTGRRRGLASLATLTLLVLIVIIPLAFLLGVFAAQAAKIGLSASRFVESLLASGSLPGDHLGSLPLMDFLKNYREIIIQRASELVGKAGSLLVEKASGITAFTVSSILQTFVFLYTMFFFLKDGRAILNRFLSYLPLPEGVERRLLDRLTSVTRATVKGVLVIGIVQGALGGTAFWIAGIDGALFWGAVMALASIIPAVGSALVWLPASVILALKGSYMQAAFVLAFCGIVVSGVDNVLRPWLVGRDTRMHELMVFFGTLGGLGLFGASGIIIGPLVAALFTTVWEIYAENLSDFLPDRASSRDTASPGDDEETSNQ